MNSIKFYTVLSFATLLNAQTTFAQVPAAAATCVACHGANGISANTMWPNLAGQKEGYLAKQMHDFKSGARKDPMMNPLVAALSDKDIEELSKYFSAMK